MANHIERRRALLRKLQEQSRTPLTSTMKEVGPQEALTKKIMRKSEVFEEMNNLTPGYDELSDKIQDVAREFQLEDYQQSLQKGERFQPLDRKKTLQFGVGEKRRLMDRFGAKEATDNRFFTPPLGPIEPLELSGIVESPPDLEGLSEDEKERLKRARIRAIQRMTE